MKENIQRASMNDISEILELQRTAFHPIANLLDDPDIQPMIQTYDELLQEFNESIILKYIQDCQIVGSVRAYVDKDNICHVGKLIVHPDYQNKGIGKALMIEIEKKFITCSKYQLFTGEITPNTLYLYTKLGYKETSRTFDSACMIIMEKSINRQMKIHKIEEAEIKSVLDFIWNVFIEFKDEDCLDIGIASFKKHIDYDSNLELFKSNKLYFYGCFIGEQLAGVVSVRDGNHICMLYVDSKFQHRGIATQLIQTIVENIRLDMIFSYVTVNSSHYAIEFYHKIGFVNQGEEQMINQIRFTPMCLYVTSCMISSIKNKGDV